MDFLSEKLNSITNNALSSINEQQRKRHDQTRRTNPDVEQSQIQTTPANASLIHSPARVGPISAGIPFGGDTTPLPGPPIGFRLDLSDQVSTSKSSPQAQRQQTRQLEEGGGRRQAESTESLYEGDTWTRLWFQRVMLLSIVRLLLFIRKVYEDFDATKKYKATGQTSQLLVAAAALILPTVVFTLYRVSRYLQIVLPALRAIKQQASEPQVAANSSQEPKPHAPKNQDDEDDDDQLRRALMSSPSVTIGPHSSSPSSPVAGTGTAAEDEEGLVTARQTPTNLQTSGSQQAEAGVSSSTSNANIGSDRRTEDQPTESVKIDKLGNLSDKHTARVVIGASEQLLHGVLFVFWQLKRQVDVLGFLVERACLWRKPSEGEKYQVGRLRTGSDGLEWFQDFYAAFLAILAQVYTLAAHWLDEGDAVLTRLRPSSINAATGALDSGASSGGGTGSDLTSRILSNALGQQVLSNGASAGKDLFILSEIIVSSAVVVSLLIAVRRRDDGVLTLLLSMLGWGAIFSSRIIIISMAFVHLGWKLTLALVVLHVLGITGWIYKIALDSHNDKPSERELEAKWDNNIEIGPTQSVSASEVELNETNNPVSSDSNSQPKAGPDDQAGTATGCWSIMEHIVLLAQILNLFAIPSLFYWPIMFNLKFHLRPYKYLVLILTQNFLLIPAIWLSMTQQSTAGQLYLLGAVGAFSIVGFIFVSLYICCKPSLTEYFARADVLFNEAENCGIYYEFCSRIFKMPDLNKHSFKRLTNQAEIYVEETFIVDK